MVTITEYITNFTKLSRDQYIAHHQIGPSLIVMKGPVHEGIEAKIMFDTWNDSAPKEAIIVKEFPAEEMKIYQLENRLGKDGRPVNPFRFFMSLGRANNNDLVFDNPFVSKTHLLFYPNGGEYQVQDNGSKNGTIMILPDKERRTMMPKQKYDLREGTLFEVGGEKGMSLFYLSTPESMYELINHLSASKKVSGTASPPGN